jgi:hypothetical protein
VERVDNLSPFTSSILPDTDIICKLIYFKVLRKGGSYDTILSGFYESGAGSSLRVQDECRIVYKSAMDPAYFEAKYEADIYPAKD